MSDLDALRSLTGKSIFSATSPWRELIGYTPKGGTRVEVYGVVAREPVDSDNFEPSASMHELLVHISTDATVGVTQPRHGDLVDITDELGDRWHWEVVEFVDSDVGRWQLRIQKLARYS